MFHDASLIKTKKLIVTNLAKIYKKIIMTAWQANAGESWFVNETYFLKNYPLINKEQQSTQFLFNILQEHLFVLTSEYDLSITRPGNNNIIPHIMIKFH